MKKLVWVMVVGCLFVAPELGQAQVDKMIDRYLQKGEWRIRPKDLRNVQMESSLDPVRQGHGRSTLGNILTDSIITNLFSNEGLSILRDKSDGRNKFSFAIDPIDGKITMILNLTSWASLYANYEVGRDEIDFQTVTPFFSTAKGLEVLSHKNGLYQGPSVEVKFRW